MKKGNKSRMTLERYEKLDGLGFKWSTSIEKKGGSAKKVGKEDDSSKDDGAAATKKKTDEATADDVNAEVEATIAAASEAALGRRCNVHRHARDRARRSRVAHGGDGPHVDPRSVRILQERRCGRGRLRHGVAVRGEARLVCVDAWLCQP